MLRRFKTFAVTASYIETLFFNIGNQDKRRKRIQLYTIRLQNISYLPSFSELYWLEITYYSFLTDVSSTLDPKFRFKQNLTDV